MNKFSGFLIVVSLLSLVNCSSAKRPNENEFDYMMQRGQDYLEDQNYLLAKKSFENAEKLNPDSYMAKFQLAVVLFTMKDHKDCELWLNKICQEFPKESSCPMLQSANALELGQLVKSIEYLSKARDLGAEPTSVGYYYQRGRILLAQNKNYNAKRLVKEGLARNPGSCELLSLIVEAADADKAYEDAMVATQDYVSQCPGAFLAHLWEGYLYYRLRQKDTSKKKFEKVLSVFAGTRAEAYARDSLRNLEQSVPLSNPAYLR